MTAYPTSSGRRVWPPPRAARSPRPSCHGCDREVYIHAVDPATGVSFADLPAGFLAVLCDDVAGPLAEITTYLTGRAHILTTIDSEVAPVLPPGSEPPRTRTGRLSASADGRGGYAGRALRTYCLRFARGLHDGLITEFGWSAWCHRAAPELQLPRARPWRDGCAFASCVGGQAEQVRPGRRFVADAPTGLPVAETAVQAVTSWPVRETSRWAAQSRISRQDFGGGTAAGPGRPAPPRPRPSRRRGLLPARGGVPLRP